jgi:hypothetical protein
LKDSNRDICRGVLVAPLGVMASFLELSLLPGLLMGVALGLAELLLLPPALPDVGETFLAGVASWELLARSLYSSGVPFCRLTDLK